MKQLTAKVVAAIEKPGKYHDGDAGLYLFVRERAGNVSKSFVQRLTIHGRRVDIGLGSVRWTTLTEARQMAQSNRKVARTGGDPRRRKAVPTFEAALEQVIALLAPTWRNPRSEAQWRASLRDYAGRLLPMRVDAITTADVLGVLAPSWNTRRETMRRVRGRISKVLEWSIAEGHRADNPAGDAITAALPKNGAGKTHHAAVPHHQVGAALAKVRAGNAAILTVLCFELIVLTATRSGEARGARWSEIDLDAKIWTIPAARMKAKREHRVPLSARAVQVLYSAREYAGDSPLVFPGANGGVMASSALSRAALNAGIEGKVHGFRSSFRDWASERTSTPHAVMEAALAHVVGDKTEAAYARSDLFNKRRELMDAWGRYLDPKPATVVAIR